MKLRNKEIYNVNGILNNLFENKMSSKLAFKLYKIKKKIEDEVIIIRESLKGKEDDKKEVSEVLNMENEIDIEKIKASELEELKLSMQDVFYLEAIIDFEEGKDE
ncbi:hypothetical protein HMPREF2852_06455 [Anaerococcus sp. HMSC065G05]|uniref:hypothetical protein n=1 Tax=Anaerococcus sp. HMSC065G05 TaxID=1739356 RepID=UPI0008A4C80B|nr:hypothetical protein [Anaerococcus sp. HMSC065G05]OFJ69668.1 hypothetical protein HMPREF2852_06455 [Anaerococcus sp. HMSC065G05]